MLEPGANPTKVFVCDIHFPDYMKFERGGTTRLIKSAFPKLHLPPLTGRIKYIRKLIFVF